MFCAHRYSHVEQSVFLIEPKENTWGVKDANKVPLATGQDYAALLTNRPINYLLNPFDGLVSCRLSVIVESDWCSHRTKLEGMGGAAWWLAASDICHKSKLSTS